MYCVRNVIGKVRGNYRQQFKMTSEIEAEPAHVIPWKRYNVIFHSFKFQWEATQVCQVMAARYKWGQFNIIPNLLQLRKYTNWVKMFACNANASKTFSQNTLAKLPFPISYSSKGWLCRKFWAAIDGKP